jgi:hypothetical protein
MKISTYAAHAIRNGIMEAKLDLETGGGCRDHEPALMAAGAMLFGSMLAFNPLEERSYQHALEHLGKPGVHRPEQQLPAAARLAT